MRSEAAISDGRERDEQHLLSLLCDAGILGARKHRELLLCLVEMPGGHRTERAHIVALGHHRAETLGAVEVQRRDGLPEVGICPLEKRWGDARRRRTCGEEPGQEDGSSSSRRRSSVSPRHPD